MVRVVIGMIVGVLFTYVFGALVAWNRNPGEWHFLWRLWCIGWAFFWGVVGASFFYEVFTKSTIRHSYRAAFNPEIKRKRVGGA